MGKATEKKAFPYPQWGKGIAAVLLLYGGSLLLGTGLVLREWVAEEALSRYTQVAMGVSVFLACLPGRQRGWRLADCLAVALLSLALVAGLGYLLYDSASISAHGLGFLLAALAGALGASLPFAPRKGRKRRGRTRR